MALIIKRKQNCLNSIRKIVELKLVDLKLINNRDKIIYFHTTV